MTEPVILAVINVVLGSIALKIVEHLINRNKEKLDEISQYRKELSEENRYLREQWRACQLELERCREELAEEVRNCRKNKRRDEE